MFSTSARLSILGLALALGALTASPVLAGGRCTSAHADGAAPLTVALARGVVGKPAAQKTAQDVYAPTGETVDLTVPVTATRVHN
jgi:hypothetical protein